MNKDVRDTPAWFGTAHTEAAKAAYLQHRRNHALRTPWEQLPINGQHDWVLIADRVIRAFQKARDELTLERVLKGLEDDEIEFLIGEFEAYGTRKAADIINEFAREMTGEEEDELFGEADQCLDTLEIRRHGHIVTTRVTQEQR